MILFYNKHTGKVIGSIEGRVHFQEHMQMHMYDDQTHKKEDVEKVVIGYEDTGEVEAFTNEQGQKGIRPVFKAHNLHLWHHQLLLEDPKATLRAHELRVIRDNGRVIDFEKH